MRFINLAEIATIASLFVSAAHSWDVEIFTSDDCSGNPNDIFGGDGNSECISLGSTTVNLKSIVMDYDSGIHHYVLYYTEPDCKCSNILTCPGQTLGTGKCDSTIFGNNIKSFKVVSMVG